MARPSLEVADILRAHGDAYLSAHAGHLSLGQLKVVSAIRACRTAAIGGHVARCENCDRIEIAYNSLYGDFSVKSLVWLSAIFSLSFSTAGAACHDGLRPARPGLKTFDLGQSANKPLCPACDYEPARHAGTIGKPVEYVHVAPYHLHALDNLDRGAGKNEKNYQSCPVLWPTETADSRQYGERCGVIYLVIMRREAQAKILQKPRRRKREHEDAGQRDQKNSPCRDGKRS
jgi:hypothetical protein